MTTQPGPQSPSAPTSRVVLYLRQGCHLCEDARVVLEEAAADVGWTEVDIDAGPGSADLVARYGDLVPVVTVDGVEQGFWRIDGGRVRRALSSPPA